MTLFMFVVIGVIALIVRIITCPTKAGMDFTRYLQNLELLSALIARQ